MTNAEKQAILDRIEKLEKRLDNWEFYKNSEKAYRMIRAELDALYAKLPEP